MSALTESLRIVSGSANPALAAAIAAALGLSLTSSRLERFPDGESRPVVVDVRGADVYLIQPTSPPVNDHVIELLLLLDSCRRGGAHRVTAVVPYLGYARQDRRSRPGEPVAARVIADALAGAGAQRLVVVDPHTAAFEAMSPIPVESLTAVGVLTAGLATSTVPATVVVAPDLGAATLAEHYATLLSRPVALIRKTRTSGATVRAEELVGDVIARPVIVIDDMISTGATIEAATQVLRHHVAEAAITVAATHGPLVSDAAGRLHNAGVRRLLVTDSTAQAASCDYAEVHTIAPLLADAINRLHHEQPLDDLLAHT